MQVLKFGGSSVANATNMNKVVEITLNALSNDKTILVASAIGGATDALIAIGRLAEAGNPAYTDKLAELEARHLQIVGELLPHYFQEDITAEVKERFRELANICQGVSCIRELTPRTLDLIMSFGELLSTRILAAKFTSMGISCKWIDSRTIIRTKQEAQQNVVDLEALNVAAEEAFSNTRTKLHVVPGFIASDSEGRTTTLGRGGSDYTASLLAAAISARRLEIWTDVCGMMTADPRIVPEAKTIENISYRAALELSHFGAKVVYPPTIQPVVSKAIPIMVKNTFDPHGKGTLIEQNPPESASTVKGISSIGHLALLSMEGSGMVGIPGYSSRFFQVLSQQGINIILITQASSVHTMLVAIEEKDSDLAKRAVDEFFAYEISLGKLEPLKVEKGYSIISLVGDDMKFQSGVSGRMFEALGNKGITIRAIAQGSSERNVSAVVRSEDCNDAVSAIHEEFFSEALQKLNVFIAGYGNVGKELINVIAENGEGMNVVGICTTRGELMERSGIALADIPAAFAAMENLPRTHRINDFVERAMALHLPNSIFVDCTSDLAIATLYPTILSAGISVVTCNKIANSLDMNLYRQVRSCAREGKASFYYDTNVGAALPVIRTLNQMISSGDTIERIDALVSGTLNYIFSEYCKPSCGETFAAIVKKAKQMGYSEPDPRTDLGGIDVLRKALILARETGASVEAEDVLREEFLPEECREGDVESFFRALERNEPYFAKLREDAAAKGGKIRYLAVIENNTVSIGLKCITAEHPFFSYEGTDSAVSISTRFYPYPVVIKGAGAGARITAGGVYGNICLCRK
ncbi:MAG: bifunctional aspartate kinase/homoserine dehydrogenase I [Bacteroidales bacterium]|nr:bifunctional aspartate kinase/homoserine dehydrogenase I [Bacteroidales bacterium]